VQYLNSALKTTTTTSTPFSGSHVVAQPRELQLGRLEDDWGTARISPDGTSGSRVARLNTVQADKVTVNDDEELPQSFAFRTSPLKRGTVPVAAYNQASNELLPSEKSQPTVIATGSVTPVRHSLSGGKKFVGTFSEEENHLLIFLKEVKRLGWKDLVLDFNAHFPGRKYHTLQTHYSTKVNKRDRSQDPATLMLPACYATEADVDWATVHESNPRPRANRETVVLQHHTHEWRRAETSMAFSAIQNASKEQDLNAESATRPERPRRAVPPKNYTWPKRNRQPQVDEEMMDDGAGCLESIEFEMQSRSEESDEELQPALANAMPVDNKPLDRGFDQDDALLALSSETRPYLTSSQRCLVQGSSDTHQWDQLCSRVWHGSVIHIDFHAGELEVVERAIEKVLGFAPEPRHASHRKRLRRELRHLTEPKFLRLTDEIHHHLPSRDRQSIQAFLKDAQAGKTRIRAPRIQRLAAARPNMAYSTNPKVSALSMIRQRELGLRFTRGWGAASHALTYQFKNKLHDSIGPAFSYTGASSDVHVAAWSTDGHCFAAGAICVDDPDSMQYNRRNNLLFGDVSSKAIHELGEHNIDRPRTESGPNSTHAMYASQDPKLYKTVSAVAFSPNGRFMFSGGYDNNVCIWETKTDGTQPELIFAMKHKAEVDMLAVNRSGLLATASKKGDNHAVKVIAIPEDEPANLRKRNLGSRKAAEKPDYKILPTALQFSPRHENLLLAGFGANARTDGRDTNGDICLWDTNAPARNEQLHVHGSGKNVFDLTFHPRHPWFAVGCVAGQNVNRGTRSIIRLYDENGVDNNSNSMKYGMRMELECKALDMNDVVWW
jgi:WD40 repeat protein